MIENMARLLLLYILVRAAYELGREDSRSIDHRVAWASGFRTGLEAGERHALRRLEEEAAAVPAPGG